MLAFHKRKTASQKNDLQGILLIFMLSPLLIFNSFGSWFTYGRYNRYYMPNFQDSIQQYHDENSWHVC